MGCWNQTCYISKLPIHAGEKVVVILVREAQIHGEHVNTPHQSYPTENYMPFGYPIYGEYDDYGGLEFIENRAEVFSYLKNFDVYGENGNKLKLDELRLENGVNQIIFGGYKIKIPEIGDSNGQPIEAKLEALFIKQELYQMLIDEVGSRKVGYDKDETFDQQFKRVLTEKIKEQQEDLKEFEEALKDYPAEKAIKHFIRSTKEIRVGLLSNFGFDMPWDITSVIKRRLLEDDEPIPAAIFDDIEYLRQIQMLKIAFTGLRMGYFCVSGDGSQSNEMKLHTIVAKFILSEAQKTVAEYKAENADADGMSESELANFVLSDPVCPWE